jgi:signal peptidase II
MSSTQKRTLQYLLLFGIAAIVIILDQWSKTLIRQNLALGEEIYPITFLAPFFRFTFWQNTGAAWGIFQNANIPLLILSSIIAVFIILYYHKALDEPLIYRISMGCFWVGLLETLSTAFNWVM